MSTKTNHISSSRKVGGDYFRLMFVRVYNTPLKYYLDKFNHNDYHILKFTNNQRLITYDELLEFKYCGYVFFKKSFNIESILEWCKFINDFDKCHPQYLVKPTPPFSPSKIIIKNEN